jgi:hypothetical protein
MLDVEYSSLLIDNPIIKVCDTILKIYGRCCDYKGMLYMLCRVLWMGTAMPQWQDHLPSN